MLHSSCIFFLVITVSLTETTASVFECYDTFDNGAGYLGKVTRPDCITWKEANSPYAKYYEDHKYCRNPLPTEISRPYCYVGSNYEFEVCDDIKRCNTDCSTGHNSVLPACDVLVTCTPPPTTANYHWNPNRTLFYVGDRVYLQCDQHGYLPSSTYSTCNQNGTFEHVNCKASVFECYDTFDNGAGYLGKVTRPDCITWKKANSPYAKYYEDHKYCRNPLPTEISRPYCYVGSNYEFEVCDDIKRCNTDCSTGHDSVLPACDVLVTCTPPPTTANYHWNPNRTLFYVGDRVYLQCDQHGYLPSSTYSTCNQNGTFEHVNCKATCQPPKASSVYRWTPEKEIFMADDILQFQCLQKGFVPSVNYSTCLSNGALQYDSVNCEGIRCPIPTITNMVPHNSSKFYRFPETVDIVCKTGSRLIGESTIHCTETGTWNHLPNCTVVLCEDLYYDKNLEIPARLTDYAYQDFVQFSCKTNYQLVGAQMLYCQADGRWNERQPICIETTPTSYGVSMTIFSSVVAVLLLTNGIAVLVVVKLLHLRRNSKKENKPEQTYDDVKHYSRSDQGIKDESYAEIR